MTLSGPKKRPEKPSPKYPWVIPVVVGGAVVVIVIGLIFAVVRGIHIF